MAVVRILDRVGDSIQQVLDSRIAPDDEVEWALSLVPTFGCEEHDGHTEIEMVVAFYIRLACPENKQNSVAHIMLPLALCDDDEIEGWVNDVWDRLVLNRLISSADLDPAEFGTDV